MGSKFELLCTDNVLVVKWSIRHLCFFLTMLRLDCKVQQYAWGKVGSDSAVAQLYVSPHRPRPAAAHQSMYMQSQASGSEIDAQSPYAEYW